VPLEIFIAAQELGWLDQNSAAKNPTQVKVALTHEEIGQTIGTSRENVSRLFAGFKISGARTQRAGF
jgi:CRP-like cAMP-binding protein